MPTMICQNAACSTEFHVNQSQLKEGKGKYCSVQCYRANQSIEAVCQNPSCNNIFHVERAVYEKGWGKYCCLQCKQQASRGPRTSRLVICHNLLCQQYFYLFPYQEKLKHGRYCSKECFRLDGQRRAVERFWKFVLITESCWIWQGNLVNGYGHFRLRGTTRSSVILAHIYSYIYFYGSIPDDLFVCHNCPGGDNPSCVNPEHLWLGTPRDNVIDAIEKGTIITPAGWNRKIHEEDVPYIRKMQGVIKRKDLAEMFNVSEGSIADVWHRRTFKSIE